MWLPLACPLLETWPITQACALDWELNQRPFGLQAGTQPTVPHQPEEEIASFEKKSLPLDLEGAFI